MIFKDQIQNIDLPVFISYKSLKACRNSRLSDVSLVIYKERNKNDKAGAIKILDNWTQPCFRKRSEL